jgi:CheY-like chemotaxis protein
MPKILLVEDNEMNRDMLSRRLVRGGYDVTIAEDGARGVEMATSDSPDLILMDMSLPVIDGWEATRRIKATPELRKIPVIALTAHAMATDRDKALEAGCDDYDTKPSSCRGCWERSRRYSRLRDGGRFNRSGTPDQGGEFVF